MIEIKNLVKKYGDAVVLDRFHCTIEKGSFVAIVGKSGSGKSTILNIVGLLDAAYTGEVTVDGQNATTLRKGERKKFIRKNISYLFQNYALIDEESIFENLNLALTYTGLSKQEKREKINEVLEVVKIKKDLQTKIYTLSGGEQQRIAFARTLLKPSKIVLADEPTGNLDDENKHQILSLFKHLQKIGKTVVVVTHDIEFAQACDQIIHLEES